MYIKLQDDHFTINGYMADCHCKCSHCLLCSGDNKISKIDFEHLKKLALKFKGIDEKYGFQPQLCVYNCAEYGNLSEQIKVNQQLSDPYAGFVNLNGTKMREGIELEEWVENLKNIGVTKVNFSWFGDREFHDRFVHRKGYFDYLFALSEAVSRNNIPKDDSVFLLRSNVEQMDVLTEKLKAVGSEPYYRLLDYRGNAKKIMDEFIRERDLLKLPGYIKESNSLNRFKPEYLWIKMIENKMNPHLSKRGLFLVATPQNIETYMDISAEAIIDMFHDLDNRLQSSIPSIEFLAKEYGDAKSDILFDYKSVIWKWTDMYFDRNPNLDKSILFSDLHTSVMWR
ncbi:hypothetical protein [Clostridium ljungdahlii]|uniref:Uncharacterized protein n=1 Tax=Clostridium ljungdahlii (strain ATCC 55383 / DSM 13528 / PETC) TaxID=748727 RepID=D8GNE6_CLOLD|nr:hypothetical protein [Clostridium ljungdahlii]ADK15809.1 hypothetical protein CLJU_c27540 [Clostridium ljungdahlii DSM 13528]OAA84322.1 hypothetical protein WX45_01181 [Clostridium ljungdahlii DSM 13528]